MTAATHFTFTDLDLPIREDMQEALQETWRRLAKPGNWLTGTERVAIAAELRKAMDCSLCKERKDSLSPASVEGSHNSNGDLPEAVVEVIHRVITDQERITRRWVEGLLEDVINGRDAQGEYVEIVGVVVLIYSVDEFMHGIGAPLEPLPEPVGGEPSWYRPPNLETETGFVPMIPVDGNTGDESDLWGEMTANVLRALTLVPDNLRDWKLLSVQMYVPLPFMGQPGKETGRAIDRMQVELVAGRVSSHNECFY